jgi:hypothetical protein
MIWDQVIGTLVYRIRYRENGTTGSWTYKANTANSKWLTGLSHATTYEYQVKTKCGAGFVSAWSLPQTFITYDLCYTPVFIDVYQHGVGSVELTWPSMANSTGYNVRYRDFFPPTPWVWLFAESNSKWVTGLENGGSYSFEIKSICNPGQTSGWGAFDYFLPLVREGSKEEALDLNLYPNPTRSTLTIEYDLGNSETAELSVFDLYGKMVMQETVGTSVGTLHLDVDDLASGQYLLRVNNEKEMAVKKFVVFRP